MKVGATSRMWSTMKSMVVRRHGRRLIVNKASNRSAVHGTKIPVTDVVVDKEKVEMEVERGKEEKEKKRKEMEDAADAQLKNGKVISPESTSNTSS